MLSFFLLPVKLIEESMFNAGLIIGGVCLANWRSCNRDRRFRLHSCELFQAGDFVRPALFDGGFQDQGDVVETFVGGDPFEACPADMAVAEGVSNFFMNVNRG